MGPLALIGAVGGAATGLGAIRSAIGGQKSSASMKPWKPAQGALRQNLRDAQSMYGSGGFRTDPFEGERVAPFSAMTQSGIGMLGGMQGMTPQVSSAFNDMLSGGGMYRDFDQIRSNVSDRTRAGLASTFAGGGINSGLAQDTYTRALGGALADVEFGAYGDQQNRRLQALGLAPDMQGMDMRAAGARLTGGGLMDDMSQRRIDADMGRHYETEDADMNALMKYSGLVQGIGGMGGQNTMTQPTSMTDWGNMASGFGSAMTAAGTLFGNTTPRRESPPMPNPRRG